MVKQSTKLELYNYLFSEFNALGVPVIRTKDLNQELPYPFIAIQTVDDKISRLTFDSYGGAPSATIHIWGIEQEVLTNDMLLAKVQDILLDELLLPHYHLFQPQMTVNETIETESNQELSHTIINIEYESH